MLGEENHRLMLHGGLKIQAFGVKIAPYFAAGGTDPRTGA
jgi:hypothetical protein